MQGRKRNSHNGKMIAAQVFNKNFMVIYLRVQKEKGIAWHYGI